MKVCFIGTHFEKLAIELQGLGQECVFVANKDFKQTTSFPSCSVRLWRIELRPLEQLKVLLFFRKQKPDLVVSDWVFPHGFFSIYAKALGIPFISHCIGQDVQFCESPMYGNKHLLRKRLLIAFSIKFIDGFFASTYALKELIANWNPEKKRLWLLPTPLFYAFPEKLLQKEKAKGAFGFRGKFVVSTLSRLHPIKGVEYLVRAMPKIIEKNKNAVLAIAGGLDGGFEEYKDLLEQESRQLGISDKVFFLGESQGEKKNLFFSASDVFVIPSIMEGVPQTLFEAMSYGLPVVSTRVGQSIDVLRDCKNCFFVQKKNPEALAEKIVFLMKNKAVSKSFSQQARKIARQYTVKNQARLWLDVFEDAKSKTIRANGNPVLAK